MIKIGKILSSTSELHEGYGKGAGKVMRTVFECPCGDGSYTHVFENIPGNTAHHYFIECDECETRYTFNLEIGMIEEIKQENKTIGQQVCLTK